MFQINTVDYFWTTDSVVWIRYAYTMLVFVLSAQENFRKLTVRQSFYKLIQRF